MAAPAAPEGTEPVREGIAQRLARMIAVPTTAADALDAVDAGEAAARAFPAYERLLAELYPLVHERLEREEVTARGLLYRWRGRRPGRAIVLMAHADVVPVAEEDAWSGPPFGGEITGEGSDRTVWGRGALDDKGAMCVLLEAVENLLRSGFVPACDVYLAFGADEETEGSGARAIAALLRERGVRPWLVLDEGGAVVDAPLPFVQGPAAMIGVAEKGFATVLLEAHGPGGHASTPAVPTTTTRIARAVRRIERRPFPVRMPASARAMLTAMLPRTGGRHGVLLRALVRFPRLGARVLARLGPEPAAVVRTTAAVTQLQGGSAHNVLPSYACATVNLRIAVGSSVQATVRRLRRVIADPEVTLTVLDAGEPTAEAPSTGPQFALLQRALAASYPDAIPVPYVMLALADARFFHAFTPASYRFAPLAMSAAERASVHGVDERVRVEALERGERFYRALLRALPGG